MKKVLGIVAGLIGIVAVYFGIVFAPEVKNFFTNLGKDNPPTEEVIETPESDVASDVVVDIENSDMLKLTKKNRISENGNVLTITAVVLPTNTTLVWEACWEVDLQEDVAEFISITPSRDTLSCDIKLLKGFKTKIELYCYTAVDPNIKAECDIYYVGRGIEFVKDESFELLFNTQDPNSFFTQVTLGDFIDMILQELENDLTYSTSGGTSKGTIKNLSISGICVSDGCNQVDIYSTSDSTSLSEFLRMYYDFEVAALDDYYADFEEWMLSDFDTELEITYDVYYCDILIQSGLTDYIYFNSNWDEFYQPESIELDDTNLYF